MDADKWFVEDSNEELPKKVTFSLERDSRGRFLVGDKPSKNRNKKNERMNKKLNELNYNLKLEFSKRRLRAADFLAYCEFFYSCTKQKIYKDLNREWAEISLQDKIIYYLFLQYIDKR